NRLPLKWGLAGCRQLLVDLGDALLREVRFEVASQLGADSAGVYRSGANATLPMPPVESHSEENVRRFRTSVSGPRFVRRSLEVDIVEIHVGKAVASRGEIDQAASVLDEWRNAID